MVQLRFQVVQVMVIMFGDFWNTKDFEYPVGSIIGMKLIAEIVGMTVVTIALIESWFFGFLTDGKEFVSAKLADFKRHAVH